MSMGKLRERDPVMGSTCMQGRQRKIQLHNLVITKLNIKQNKQQTANTFSLLAQLTGSQRKYDMQTGLAFVVPVSS